MKLEQTVRKLKEIATYSWEDYNQNEGLKDRAERREEGIISLDLAETMQKIAGFRNILVHDYLEIDQQIVYATLNKLQDFREFAQCIYRVLD